MDCSDRRLYIIETPTATEHYTSVLLNGNVLDCSEVRQIVNRTTPTWINVKNNPTLAQE
jgi:hypothetical protein